MQYPAKFEEAEEGGYVVTFRDIPEAVTQGDTEDEAMEMAEDVLISSMDFYFDDRRTVPLPSKPLKGERLVELPLSIAAKVLLLNEIIKAGISNAELARRLHTRPQDVQRIVTLKHPTKIHTLNEAVHALGKRLDIRLT